MSAFEVRANVASKAQQLKEEALKTKLEAFTGSVGAAPIKGYVEVGSMKSVNQIIFKAMFHCAAGIDRRGQRRQGAHARGPTAKRVASLPDVPTIGESVPGFEIGPWQGIGAPKKTPTEIIAALNREINAGLADPKVKTTIFELGGEPAPISTAGFEKRVVDETARWAKVIRDAKIRSERSARR